MTLANLIVNVEANTAKLITGVEAGNKSLDSMTSMAGKLAGAIGIGFSVGSIIAFGKSLLDDADQLVKLHDQTAITLQDLQRLQVVGDDAGVALDAMASAVNKLQKNIGSDNDGAAGALATIGLKMEDIKTLSPENQFYEISKALAAVKDPALQVALGTALMGKGFVEVLPAIKAGFEDVRHASVGMSDETIRNLDWVGDTWTKLWRTTKGVVANMLVDTFNPSIAGYNDMVASITGAYNAAMKMTPVIAKVMPHQVVVDVKEFDRAMEGSSKQISDAASKLRAHNDALDKVNQKITDATRFVGRLTDAQITSVHQYKELGLSNTEIALKMGITESQIKRLEEAETFAASATQTLYNKAGTLATTIPDVTTAMHDFSAEVEPLATSFIPELNAGMEGLPKSVIGGKNALDGIRGTSRTLGDTLQDVSNDFVQMAQIAGGSWGGALQAIGETVKAVQMVGTAMASIETKGFSAVNLTALAGGWIGVVTVLWQVSEALGEMHDQASRAHAKLVFAYELGQQFHTATKFSDALIESLMRTDAELGHFAASFLLVNGIVEELGGYSHLTAAELKAVEDNLWRVTTAITMGASQGKDIITSIFDLIALGGPVGASAVKVLNDALVGMGEAAVGSGGLVSKFFVDMVRRAEDAGVALDDVNKFILGQLGEAAKGLNTVLTGLQDSATAAAKAQAKALKTMTDDEISHLVGSFTVTAEQGAGLASAIVANFAEMIDRGMSLGDALDALQPSSETLRASLTASGVDGGAAFTLLTELSTIAGDAIKGPLFDALQGANQALQGLHNSGILNQEMFTALTITAVDTYNKISDGGKNAAAANVAIAPTLQTIWALQKDFGYAVDDATQALIDEAVKVGSVGDKHRPMAEQMLIATQGIQKAVEGLAKVFGVTLPAAAETAANGVNVALDKIKTPHVAPPWADWGDPPRVGESGESGGDSSRGFASGTHGRYLNFGAGTAVTLHGRERVVTEREGRAEAASNADVVAAINALRRDLPRAVAVASTSAALRNRRAA